MDTINDMEKQSKKRPPVIFETVYQGDDSPDIASFLKKESPLSGRSLRQYFFKGLVRLNRKKAHSLAKLKSGDHLQVLGSNREHLVLKPEALPLEVVYEDDRLLVINKPALLAVHPSGGITSGTLANGVAAYFQKNGLNIKVRPVNRLDYGTSGLIIFAKSPQSQMELSKAIQEHLVVRIYYAVVSGIPNASEGIIKAPIMVDHKKRVVAEEGRQAETHYRVVKEFQNASLLELELRTGRTHQIRVHLNYIKTPIIGDTQYGIKSPVIKRPALHAGKLIFREPSLPLPELTAPFPEDFQNLLETYIKKDRLANRS
ncbi:MAG: RluA family pseudouridine synthase [Bacillota bacterium]